MNHFQHLRNMASLFMFLLTCLFIGCGKDDGPDVIEDPDPCENTDLSISITEGTLSLTVEATGGAEPYTYSIDGENFQSSDTFEDLDIQSYTISVSDANGCIVTIVATPTDPCADLSISVTPDAYSLIATGTGGTAPYEFSIDGETFQSSGTFESLDIQEYIVTVSDANGCTDSTAATPIDPCADLDITVTPDIYSLTAVSTGGTEPYEYSIDGEMFQSSGVFEDLEIQQYTVTVSDANGCQLTQTATPTDPCANTDLDISIDVDINSIEITGTGGFPPYEYAIDNGAFQTSGAFSDLSYESHTLTVRDVYGCTSSSSAFPGSDNPVAHFPLNGNANDDSGNEFNGTVSEATLAADRNGSADLAYHFDGVDDYIVTSNEIDELLATEATFSAWIYMEGSSGRILSNYNGEGAAGNCNERIGFVFYVTDEQELAIFYATDGNDFDGRKTAVGSIESNQWYHVLATWDGTFDPTGFEVYIDGVKSDTQNAEDGNVSCGGFKESLNEFHIGIGHCESGLCGPFDGSIDEVRIYNRVLSSGEILSLSEN